MSLLFEVVKNINKKIVNMPPLEAAMQRIEAGEAGTRMEDEICLMYKDLEELEKRVRRLD